MSVCVMKKLTVLASERDADKLVRRLMRLRCVEIDAVPLGDLPDGGTLLRYDCDTVRAEAERRVADVTAVLPILDGYAVHAKPPKKPIAVTAEAFRASGRLDAARGVVSEVLEIRDGRVACQNEHNRLEALCRSLAPWLEYSAPLEGEATERCEIWLGTLPAKTLISEADDALSDLHAGVEEVSRDKDAFYVSVLLMKEDSDAVARALAGIGFTRISFKGLPSSGTAAENHRQCIRRMGELDNQLQTYSDRLLKLADKLDEVRVLYDVEMTTLTAARQKQKLAATEHCAVLEGWVPAEREERVAAALDRLPCAYGMEDPAEEDEPPVLLKNNAFASNFEWVVGMYSYPKYGTYDPTFIMSIYYFVIFGLMFADVGYGLLIMLGGFLAPKLVKVSPGMKRMLTMFGYCGIACTILGAVFGGWFGDLPYAIMTNYMGYESTEAAQAAAPWFNGVTITLNGEPLSLNPLVNPIPFLIISLAMGLIHIVGGMAVKFYILCREGKVFSAIFDIGSYWILFAGIGVLFIHKTVGLALVIAGVALIVLTHGRDKKNIFAKLLFGLKGLYDLISYASDLLSYSRILALGLAAGVMAQVFNLLGTLGGVSIPGFILLIFVMLVGHGLNISINLLGSFVHACRLQYLEFFSKFYEDGGVPFEPALPSDQYSTVECDVPKKKVAPKAEAAKKSSAKVH
ncbi:MAG: V-type ATP synthase subunit I [Clostridia bacterium]|nr:V-type ATP synthase subunit I [Clostridia bacterium]